MDRGRGGVSLQSRALDGRGGGGESGQTVAGTEGAAANLSIRSPTSPPVRHPFNDPHLT